jgi:hypothetical protein
MNSVEKDMLGFVLTRTIYGHTTDEVARGLRNVP